MAKVPFQLRLPSEVRTAMDNRKERTGESLTDIVVTAVKQYLNLK